MSDGWKSFFRGLAAGAATVLGAVVTFLLLRGRSKDSTPEGIAASADAQVEEKRQEIKADSDEALAQRFNSLGKKD